MKTKDEKEKMDEDQQRAWDTITWTIYTVDAQGKPVTLIERQDREYDAINLFADSSKKMAENVKERVLKRETSPIEYYMHKHMMDPSTLAKAMGIGEWRVKRHFKPHIFKKLDPRIIKEYATLFKVDINNLLDFREDM